MWALTYSPAKDPWETTKGFFKRRVPAPVLDEQKDPRDTSMAIVKVKLAGVCGSDRGIWFRHALRDLIQDSLQQELKEERIIGHEFLGEVAAIGTDASQKFNIHPGDLVSAESHIICGRCYQCRTGDTHVCVNTRIIGISADGCFAPVGSNGFYARGKEMARFDQQPVEACAMVSACLEAHGMTGDDRWRAHAENAFDWYLGRNDLRTPVYDPATGGCRDGLHPDRVNRNQGGESTLSFLMSLAEMKLAQSVIREK